MADDLDELGRRLDRIEHALRRPPDGPSRTPVGPEIRSARSIVNRVDDVWVAVTEGNERLVTAVGGLRAEIGRLASALLPTDPREDEADHFDNDFDPDQQRGPGSWKPPPHLRESGLPGPDDRAVDRPGDRLARMEEVLANIAGPSVALGERLGRIEEALRVAAEDGSDPAVHLRLNRVEEALAGIAGRLEALAAGTKTSAPTDADDANRIGVQAAVDALGSEVSGLAGRVEGLAQALEASATRGADGTLTDRLGRLRDQFRR